ncbi:protein FAR1-RELATED SEQUENCE [Trifolium repens]|nr:protein FAR1-RELATED SEQUENCE [Trifolium repens]
MEATHKLQKSLSTHKMKNTTQATKSKALGPIPNFSIGLTPSDEEKSDDNKANMRGKKMQKKFDAVHEPDEVFAANYDDVGNEVILDEVINENLLAKSVDHHRLDERVVTIDTDKKIMSCTCRMFENRGFLCRHVFRILEYLGGSVQYHGLKTIPAEYVLKRWCRDARQSFDKLNSTVDVATEATTQAQRYQQICAVTVQLSTRVSVDPEASQIFLNGVLEAGKKAEELLMRKGIGTVTGPSSGTPSKSSNTAAASEPSDGIKSTAPKFKARSNPIRSKKRLKSDYELSRDRQERRERQKLMVQRKNQMRDDEAQKGKEATD